MSANTPFPVMTKPFSISLHNTVSQNKDIIFSNLDQETILLSIKNSKYYGMESTGSRIWDLMVEPIAVDRLVQLLMSEYDINNENCTTDTLLFLEKLLAENLITAM